MLQPLISPESSVDDTSYMSVARTDHVDKMNYKLFFKDEYGNLLAYIMFNFVPDRKYGDAIYMIDITNGHGFEHMSPEMQQFYLKNGFDPKIKRKGYGEIALTKALEYIKEEFPQIRVIPVAGLDANKGKIWDLVEKVQKNSEGIITRLGGQSEMSVLTIFIRD